MLLNVSEALLRRYLEVFHETYKETAAKFLPQEVHQFLVRPRFLSRGITGYLSTNFGAGFEYGPADSSEITIKRSSRRIEDIFTGAPSRIRKMPAMFKIGGSNCFIWGWDTILQGTFPFRLTSEQASVTLFSVEFRVQRWRRVVQYAELYGDRSAAFWSETNAVSRAKDEILVALLYRQEAQKRYVPLADYMNAFKEKTVLLLGDYSSDGRVRLEEIKAGLMELGYAPIILDEVPDHLDYDLAQKAVAVGSVARFVVFDDSSKSGHLAETDLAQINRWIVIVLRLERSAGSFMTRGMSHTSRVILEKTYTSLNLREVLTESAQWAEQRIAELRKGRAGVYPWRSI